MKKILLIIFTYLSSITYSYGWVISGQTELCPSSGNKYIYYAQGFPIGGYEKVTWSVENGKFNSTNGPTSLTINYQDPVSVVWNDVAKPGILKVVYDKNYNYYEATQNIILLSLKNTEGDCKTNCVK